MRPSTFCRLVPLALLLSSSGLAQTATYRLGDSGCNSSPLSHCTSLNATNPVLQIASLPNEYAYPASNTTASPIQVVGFDIYTRTNSGTTTEVGNTGFCWDNSGWAAVTHTIPTAAWTATGSITVGPTEGWYSTTLVPPVLVLPGEVFWITADAFSLIVPPQHVATGGVNGPVGNYWRRPNYLSNAWTLSGSVFRPIYRIRCATGSPAVPYVSASNPPRLGQPLTLTLGGGLPQSLGIFIFSSDNSNFFGLPTPFDLTPFGAPHCRVHCTWETMITVGLDAQGTVSISGTVPNLPSFAGVSFYNQGLVLAPGVNAVNLLVSNLGTGVFGS